MENISPKSGTCVISHVNTTHEASGGGTGTSTPLTGHLSANVGQRGTKDHLAGGGRREDRLIRWTWRACGNSAFVRAVAPST